MDRETKATAPASKRCGAGEAPRGAGGRRGRRKPDERGADRGGKRHLFLRPRAELYSPRTVDPAGARAALARRRISPAAGLREGEGAPGGPPMAPPPLPRGGPSALRSPQRFLHPDGKRVRKGKRGGDSNEGALSLPHPRPRGEEMDGGRFRAVRYGSARNMLVPPHSFGPSIVGSLPHWTGPINRSFAKPKTSTARIKKKKNHDLVPHWGIHGSLKAAAPLSGLR